MRQATLQEIQALPYWDVRLTLFYVSEDDVFMQEAMRTANELSLEYRRPLGIVLLKDGKVIGRGANGSEYHKTHGCERVRLNIPPGEGYELCEGCHPKNHGEPKAIQDTLQNGNDPRWAIAYLWGHYWCCEPCCNAMIAVGIEGVVLLEGATEKFKR